MDLVIKIIGIVIVFFAIIYLLKPDILKRLLEFFKKGKRIYLAALIRLTFAVLFLLDANECKMPWVIIAFGILFLLSGLLIFILGVEKTRTMIEWWQKQSTLLVRIIGLIALAIGALIIYAA